MGKIIDIDCNDPHLTGELICLNCDYRYIGTWNEKVWFKDLYCPNCNVKGYTIGTGQILEAAYPEDCTKNNPKKMSKPGQIILFPGQKIGNVPSDNND